MKLSTVGFAVLASVGLTFAATDTVWTAAEGDGAMAPAYWYGYTYGTGASLDTNIVNSYRVIDYTVSTSSDNGAGYSLTWKQNAAYKDTEISLASYKGVCLTYKADYPVRLDFRQSTITDDNYYGTLLAASANFKKYFVAFSDLVQDWKSTTTIKWKIDKQLGMQFSYKNTYAKTYGSKTNTLTLSSIILSDSCVSYAPVLLEPYASNTKPYTLLEVDTLSLPLSKIFYDEDGDDLKISVTVTNSSFISLLEKEESFSLNDTLHFIAAANKTGEAIVTLKASDGKNSVSYFFTVDVQDLNNAPTAVNDTYSVNEDDTLKVTYKNGVLVNDYDVDKNGYTMTFVDSTSHGVLTLDVSDGSFTYVPVSNYCGTDSWTYKLTDETDLQSSKATVKIQVKCVNDAPTVQVLDEDFLKNLVFKEDFADTAIAFSSAQILFKDVDGDDLTIGAYGDDLIHAGVTTVGSKHYIEFSPVDDAYGTATVTLYGTDGMDTAKVNFHVTIESVADVPKAHEDEYEMYEDSVVTIAAKKGVLANDVNPDDSTDVLLAYLVTDAANGKVNLKEDGSFTYTPDADFVGADSFSYVVVNSLGDSSNVATVRMNVVDRNDAPVVAIDTAAYDTLVRAEDFTSPITFTATETKTWFTDPDGDKIYLSVESDDGKLNPSISAAGVVTLKSVRDAFGDAYVTVTGADGISGSSSFKIHVYLTPVNDKPRTTIDTLVLMETHDFVIELDLDTLLSDPDEEPLTYKVTNASGVFSTDLDGSILTITPAVVNDTILEALYVVRIQATDSSGESSISAIFIDVGGKLGIVPKMTLTKNLSWQQAIAKTQGFAKLYDMKGHVLWQGRLPASESEVREAATRAAGKTILRVNRSQWMLNSEILR